MVYAIYRYKKKFKKSLASNIVLSIYQIFGAIKFLN
nr:MAG TPA: hypothetical protein [Caudoviricetes sp.]